MNFGNLSILPTHTNGSHYLRRLRNALLLIAFIGLGSCQQDLVEDIEANITTDVIQNAQIPFEDYQEVFF